MSTKPSDTLYLEPFQLRLPDSEPMIGTNAEGYSTFVAKLQRGLLGVEAELTLFTVETEEDGSFEMPAGPGWWSALGATWLPGPEDGDLAYHLVYLPNTYLEVSYASLMEFDLGILDKEDDFEHPLINHSGFQLGESLDEAKTAFIALLTHHLAYRPVTDPVAQIPRFKPEHRTELYRYSGS